MRRVDSPSFRMTAAVPRVTALSRSGTPAAVRDAASTVLPRIGHGPVDVVLGSAPRATVKDRQVRGDRQQLPAEIVRTAAIRSLGLRADGATVLHRQMGETSDACVAMPAAAEGIPSWVVRPLPRSISASTSQSPPRTMSTPVPIPQVSGLIVSSAEYDGAPPILVAMFRMTNAANLAGTNALRQAGYSALRARLSAESRRGVLPRHRLEQVVMSFMTSNQEALDVADIVACFDRECQSGEAELAFILLGFQLLLGWAAPGDAMRYAMHLLEASAKQPRYITRYEVQSLILCAEHTNSLLVAKNEVAAKSPSTRSPDVEYLIMRAVVNGLAAESDAFDYQGRMPLRTFLSRLTFRIDRAMSSAAMGLAPEAAAEAAAAEEMRERQPDPRLPTTVLRSTTPGRFVQGAMWSGNVDPVARGFELTGARGGGASSIRPVHQSQTRRAIMLATDSDMVARDDV